MAAIQDSGRINKPQIKKRIESVNVWARGDERAPHKPLLILLSLARISQGHERLTSFTELETALRRLLIDFGPPRKSIHPEYPFWRLQNDGLWEVPSGSELKRRKSGDDVLKSELVKRDVKGGFPEAIYEIFHNDRRFLTVIARMILDAHFPSSLHSDILNEIGLSTGFLPSISRRDSNFRESVIQAYERRCAVCGYDARMDYADLGLEAAHIKWVLPPDKNGPT